MMETQTQTHLSPLPAQEYRKLPSVDALLQQADVTELIDAYGLLPVTESVRHCLEQARQAIAQGEAAPDRHEWSGRIAHHLRQRFRPTLRPVINATGVIIHTNLGRAPLSAQARQAINQLTAGYATLEYDEETGRRGSRHLHARQLLCHLTAAEDALVVNNCASALFFVLSALCRDKDVVISRGQLVEIGGGFRIPDVLRQSGARLVEVGTTNRTHRRDFEAATRWETGALLRVHSSNFRQIGFVTEPTLAELVAVAEEMTFLSNERPLVIDDLGSGCLLETAPFGLAPEPTVQASIQAGVDLVLFSGDKLLGGPQAGIILGRAELVESLRRHPLARALRVDKLTLAALTATLESYARGRATAEIPIWRMIAAPAQQILARAQAWQAELARLGIPSQIVAGESAVGGGSLPGETLPTHLLALDHPAPEAVAHALRQSEPAIVCRIQGDRLLLDPRTVAEAEEAILLDRVREAMSHDG